jgi:hypothetical protein
MVGVKADNAAVMSAMSATFRRLARLTGFSQRQVLLAEAGAILKTCAYRTKVSSQESADRFSRLHGVHRLGLTGSNREKNLGDVTVNAGYRPAPYGRVWIKVRAGKGKKGWLLAKGANFSAPSGTATFTPYRRKLNGTSGKWLRHVDEAVTDVQDSVARSIPKGRRSIGLARQSWLQIADALGIDLLKVPGGVPLSAGHIAKARAALAASGKAHRNGFAAQGGSGGYDFIDLINRYPGGRSPKLAFDRTLLGVLAGRAKFFQQSYAKGAFDSQEKAVRAYPNLFRSRRAA